MSIYDRDWYKDEFQKKEQEYGGDFSLNSKKSSFSREKILPIKKNTAGINLMTFLFCPVLTYLSTYVSITFMDGSPIFPIAVTILSIILFSKAARRRRIYDKSILNVLALIFSMISFVFSTVLSFFLIYIPLSEGRNPFFVPNEEEIRQVFQTIPNPFVWYENWFSFSMTQAILSPETVDKGPVITFTAALFALLILIPIIQRSHVKKKIRGMTENAVEMTPDAFLRMKSYRIGKRQIATDYDFPGVYVLLNKTKNMYYVGQGQKVMSRVKQHFSGHGNGDVYADWKYGDEFTIRLIKLEGSGFGTLNTLERNTIATYNAFSRGYNKTRGNRG